MLRVRSPQDIGAAAVLMLIGLAGVYFGRDLNFGSSARMGPGFFPTILSWLILAIGALIGVKAFMFDGPPIRSTRLRPIFFVCAAILLFGAAIEYIGLALTAILVTFVAAAGNERTRWGETAILSVILAVFSVSIFIYGLGQPMPAFWAR
ncbi:MAG: Tripartite tricarboxylate transporter TctB family [Hyphomicrobiales bacterium]|nr:Tripartite tricarboxylate transporter TctB family [Hyphomicrobiales bacterium]